MAEASNDVHVHYTATGTRVNVKTSAFVPGSAASAVKSLIVETGSPVVRNARAEDLLKEWNIHNPQHIGVIMLVEPVAELVLASRWRSLMCLARWPLSFPTLHMPGQHLRTLKGLSLPEESLPSVALTVSNVELAAEHVRSFRSHLLSRDPLQDDENTYRFDFVLTFLQTLACDVSSGTTQRRCKKNSGVLLP